VLVQYSQKECQPVFISNNWLSHGFPGAQSKKGEVPPFANPDKGDFHISGDAAELIDKGMSIPKEILDMTALKPFQYKAPVNLEVRPVKGMLDLGAYEYFHQQL